MSIIPIYHVGLIFALTVMPLRNSVGQVSESGQQQAAQALLQQLENASLIHCDIYAGPRAKDLKVIFTEPRQLQRVRAWIRRYAWPPIDLNTVGNVMPRAVFSVYTRRDDKQPAFTIQVFGATTRAEPAIVHVTTKDWNKFLALIPQK